MTPYFGKYSKSFVSFPRGWYPVGASRDAKRLKSAMPCAVSARFASAFALSNSRRLPTIMPCFANVAFRFASHASCASAALVISRVCSDARPPSPSPSLSSDKGSASASRPIRGADSERGGRPPPAADGRAPEEDTPAFFSNSKTVNFDWPLRIDESSFGGGGPNAGAREKSGVCTISGIFELSCRVELRNFSIFRRSSRSSISRFRRWIGLSLSGSCTPKRGALVNETSRM